MFITLAGIMFASGRFDEDSFYDTQRDVLAIVVLLVIVVSVGYIIVVLLYDVLIAFRPQCFKKRDTKATRLQFAGWQAAKEELAAKTRVAIYNNPMMDRRMATLKGGSLPLSNPTPALWEAFRSTYADMEKTLDAMSAPQLAQRVRKPSIVALRRKPRTKKKATFGNVQSRRGEDAEHPDGMGHEVGGNRVRLRTLSSDSPGPDDAEESL